MLIYIYMILFHPKNNKIYPNYLEKRVLDQATKPI